MNVTKQDDLLGAIVQSDTTGNHMVFERHPDPEEDSRGYLREWYGCGPEGKLRESANCYTTHWRDVQRQMKDGSYRWVTRLDPEPSVQQVLTEVASMLEKLTAIVKDLAEVK